MSHQSDMDAASGADEAERERRETCGQCGSRECPWLRGTGACPAAYAASLPVLDGGRVLAPDGRVIGEVVDDTLADIYAEAAYRDRRCPECGSRSINATETVCLACSNRAWSDR